MTEEINTKKYEEIIKKMEALKASGSLDLSTEEDLAIAVMNLISLEEHLYFTGAKTDNEAYWVMLNEVREMRKTLLAKMIPMNEGETWCTSKHLLSATMRLIEVGVKLFSEGKKDEAKGMYDKAHQLFSTFWALRLKLIEIPKNLIKEDKPMSLSDIMDKLVDCCKE